MKYFVAVLLAVILVGCELDQGLGPLQTRISGKITYLFTDQRPTNVDEIRVAALVKFPPAGLADVVFSEPLDFRGDSVRFDFYIPKGDYQALVLLWRTKNQNWSFNSILGVYGFEPLMFQLDLLPVSINDEQPTLDDVDMTALWNFAASDASINGRITYVGTPPADTELLLLAAFNRMPLFDNFPVSLLFLGGLPFPMSASRNPASFQLKVFNNTYPFVGLFWKGVDTAIEDVKLIGYYRDPLAPDVPGTVIAPQNGSVSNINFTADFTTLPDGIRP